MKISIQSWLRYIAVVLLVLTGGLSAVAQNEEIEGGEAFYIYQNDGHFDGFFYDQVKEIRYSRLDTLGIERSEYVSQEIVTEDSVYRIMLTAIDSVSYVQPEIHFAKGVRFMRDEGMLDYYITCSDMNLAFDLSMPQSLRPKKGDVLSCPVLEDHDGAFVGKVFNVKENGGFLIVECDYIDKLSDVFDQFVTVEQVKQVATPEGTRMRRRIAGLHAPKREGHFELNLFNATVDIEGSLYPTEKCKVGIALHGGLAMAVKAVYNISWSDFYIKAELIEQFQLGAKVQFDGEAKNTVSAKNLPGVGALISRFSKVPFPASFPIMYVDVVPEPFTRVEAHINASLAYNGEVKCLMQSLELMDREPYLRFRFNTYNGLIMPVNTSSDKGLSLTAELNGFVQSGLKFPIELGTEDWMSYLAECKAENILYAGPKISGAISFDVMKENDNIYDTFKDTKLNLSLMSIDDEYGITFKWLKKKVELKDTRSGSYFNMDFKLFPDISGTEMELVGDNEDIIDCGFDVDGDVFFPQKIGFGLYTKENENDIYYKKLERSIFRDEVYFMNTFNGVNVQFTDVKAGEYRLRPLVLHGILGYIPVYSQEKVVIIEPKELTLKPEEITVEEEGGEFEVTLVTKQDMPILAESNDEWITIDIEGPSGSNKYNVMHVKVAANDTDHYRTGTVTVRQRYSTTEYVDKTFTVHQYGGMELSVGELEFEAGGGDQTVDILTSFRPITINLNGSDDWITYQLDDHILHIITKENTQATRTATIIIAAWNEKAQGIRTVKLTITQKGLVEATVDPAELSFEAAGGSQRVNVKMGAECVLKEVTLGNEGAKEWLVVETASDHFNVTAMPNTGSEERTATIYCIVSQTKGGVTTDVILTVNVTQNPNDVFVSPTELTFKAEGGIQDVTVSMGSYDSYDASVDDSDANWASAKVNGDGTVTITVEANTTNEERTTTVSCYVYKTGTPASQWMTLPVKVTQEASKVGVTPSSLIFTAAKATKNVKVIKDTYKYYGFKIGDSDKEWISGTVEAGDNVAFTVQENTTSDKRTATVWCYVSNEQYPTESQKVYFPVSIIQEPAGVSDLKWITFDVKTYEDIEDKPEPSYYWGHQDFVWDRDGNISTTRNGDRLHVVVSRSIESTALGDEAVYDYTVSFDIDDMKLVESEQAKILNFKYHMVRHGKTYRDYDFADADENEWTEWYSTEKYVGISSVTEEDFDIPVISMSGEQTWERTEAEGALLHNFKRKEYEEYCHSDGRVYKTHTYNMAYPRHPNNYITIAMDFKKL